MIHAQQQQAEKEREQRIRQGQAEIDRAFRGATRGVDPLQPDAQFDPNAQFFTARGDVWRPRIAGGFGNSRPRDLTGADAESMFRDMVEQGGLFSDVERTGGFDDAFFNNYRQQFLDFYNPQLDRQHGEAQQKTNFGLARQGLGQSSVAGDRHGELARVFADRQAEIGSQATQAEMQQRQNVNQLQDQLYSMNLAAADPSLARSRAAAAVSGVSDAPTLSPLENAFTGLFGGLQAHQAGRNQFFAPFHQQRQSPGINFGNPNSSTTVVGR